MIDRLFTKMADKFEQNYPKSKQSAKDLDMEESVHK